VVIEKIGGVTPRQFEVLFLRRYARALTHNMTAADAVPMMEALIKKE
jgi:hypothetical protein